MYTLDQTAVLIFPYEDLLQLKWGTDSVQREVSGRQCPFGSSVLRESMLHGQPKMPKRRNVYTFHKIG